MALLPLILCALAFAAPAEEALEFHLTREPAKPGPSQQYRLILDAPKTACASKKSVSPLISKSEFVVSSNSRTVLTGCRWIWVMSAGGPAASALPDIELVELAGGRSLWKEPPATLLDAVTRFPEKYMHKPPCATFRPEEFVCRFKNSSKVMTVVVEVGRDENGEYYVGPSEQGRKIAESGKIGKKKMPLGKLVDGTPQTIDADRVPDSHFYRCVGDTIFHHYFENGRELVREYKVTDKQILAGGNGGVLYTCLPGAKDSCSELTASKEFVCDKLVQ